jgi:hypothetical protein
MRFSYSPGVPIPWRSVLGRRLPSLLQSRARRRVFTDIFRNNRWLDGETPSGPGSTLARTARLRRELPPLLERFAVGTLLDLPCGDFHWMREVDLGERTYIGADIVPEIVRDNRRRFGDGRRRFLILDLVSDRLPAADLVLCRDCLFHLPLDDIERALRNVAQSGARFLLTTTFPGRGANAEAPIGAWRPLDLEAAPFHLPPPAEVIVENPDGEYPDKSLGLWPVETLRERFCSPSMRSTRSMGSTRAV